MGFYEGKVNGHARRLNGARHKEKGKNKGKTTEACGHACVPQ